MLFKLLKICVALAILNSFSNIALAMDLEEVKEIIDDPIPKKISHPQNTPKKILPKKTALQLEIGNFNRKLELSSTETSFLIDEEKPNMVWGVIIYTLAPPKNEEKKMEYKDVLSLQKGDNVEMRYWDNQSLFLSEFDRNRFLKKRSKKTIFLQILGALEGTVGAAAMVPLALDLMSNIDWIPFGGVGGALIAFIPMSLCAPATSRQMYERMGKIGDFLFDHSELTSSKSDQKPHIQSLTLDKETKGCGKSKKCKYSYSARLNVRGSLFSCISGLCEALPYTLLLWKIERLHPIARGILIGPLALLYFEKAFNEGQRFTNGLAHQYLTELNHMVSQKKKTLINGVKEMLVRLNAKESDKRVLHLYKKIQEHIKKLREDSILEEKRKAKNNEDKEEIVEIGITEQERFSIISMFFLKRDKIESFKEATTQLKEKTKTINDEELREVVNTIDVSNPQKMSNLLGDISYIPSQSYFQMFLENGGTFFHLGATISRTIVLEWALKHALSYVGISSPYVSWGSASIATVIKAINDWQMQRRAFANLKDFWPRMDFRPARFLGNLVSVVGGAFFSLVPGAVIYQALGDTTPSWLKALLTIAAVPSEFNAFNEFFREKYQNTITGIGTLKPCTIGQKRAWLNEEGRKILEIIPKLDQSTTEELNQMINETL